VNATKTNRTGLLPLSLVIYLSLYHPLLFLFLFSYYRTMFTSLAGPTNEVTKDERRVRFQETLSISSTWVMRKANESLWLKHSTNVRQHCFVFVDGRTCLSSLDITTEVCFSRSTKMNNDRSDLLGVRYCFACRCIKPDRAHHCSICGKCVLRYDHHCPW
jgi:hypothetical protein